MARPLCSRPRREIDQAIAAAKSGTQLWLKADLGGRAASLRTQYRRRYFGLRDPVFDKCCVITASVAKCLQEQLCYGCVPRWAPMTVRKKMVRIGSHCFVEIDADIRKL